MRTKQEAFEFTRGKLIFDFSKMYCDTAAKLLQSELFFEVIVRFLSKLEAKESPIFITISEKLESAKSEYAKSLVNLFRLLISHRAEEIMELNKEYKAILSEKQCLVEFIEELYNFWRRFERFFYIEAPKRENAKDNIHHAQFIKYNIEFKNLVLEVYRTIEENVSGTIPRTYRQLPAGTNMAMLIEKIDWQIPNILEIAKDVPFIRLTVMESPLILYPEMNTRKGSFTEIYELKKDMVLIVSEEWFCYPAKIGELTAFLYFHQDFISQGLSLSNLFKIAEHCEIKNKQPDIVLFFGIKNVNLPESPVFYEDKDTGMLIGLLAHSKEIDYFGYFKKMPLTLHNISMIRKGRLPFHGAMANLKVKGGSVAGVVLVGDSGAGKSETLEAMRTLADEHIREMKIIFDDMGSINAAGDKKILGYGTEIGAFVRLDDLQAGYAYEEIDRSIFMNPDKINARLIIPIANYDDIIKGCEINIVLYANNYEEVDEEHPILEFFNTAKDALDVFRSGARLAKGTTDEKGIVHTYFANPFGAPHRKTAHEACAEVCFNKMFDVGVKVGQIRTRLGIKGFEYEGPKQAAMELFKMIKERR
ncbi:phosphoenolpyruvate carboxykinase [Candidatus Magnetoovum chiemensis]|nr:phosphoenolpyruvate carboxykinase [Candidatus Magnetoovum chiemensis]